MTLGPDGLHLEDPNSITTWTGKRVAPLALDPNDVDIRDIAHALSRQCRYNGHVEGFVSVARHSLWVSYIVENEMLCPDLALTALLHDAAEAYLGDLVRPLKRSAFGEAYIEAEQQAEAAIAKRFGTPYPIPVKVREADHQMLMLELEHYRDSYSSTPDLDERDFLKRYAELVTPVRQYPPIIGLAGYAQAGKDTLGQILVEEHGYTRLAFADVLRESLYALNPVVDADLVYLSGGYDRVEQYRLADIVDRIGWDAAKTDYPGVRELLQRLGTEAGRAIHGEDVWVNATFAKMDSTTRYVITDVRFQNEADAIKKAGGQVWRVRRSGTGPVNDHPSETALDDYHFDQYVDNDQTVVDLSRAVESVGR